jgi:hypothetical protein
LEWALRMMPIAHHSCVTCLSRQVGKLRQITGKLCLDCCRDQLLGSRSQQIRQRVRRPVSTRKTNNVSRFHGGVSPSVGLLSRNNNSTRYAANLQITQTPDSVIAPNSAVVFRRLGTPETHGFHRSTVSSCLPAAVGHGFCCPVTRILRSGFHWRGSGLAHWVASRRYWRG